MADLATIARRTDFAVTGIGGWENRGRPGPFAPKGILWHHTGGKADSVAYARWMAITGRSDLPAPLCQVSIRRAGQIIICAAGRANHAGVARAIGKWLRRGDGNAQLLGIEFQNTGSEGFPEAQYKAGIQFTAEWLVDKGLTATNVAGHRETSITGKWDPGKVDMDRVRRDVRVEIQRITSPVLPKPGTKPGTKPAPVRLIHLGTLRRQAALPAGKRTRTTSVLRLQKALADRTDRKKLPLTGKWDRRTKSAVRRFQLDQGFRGKDADGQVGPDTLRRLVRGTPFTAKI